MTTPRMPAADRTKNLLDLALREAHRVGYTRVTRESIAAAAGVTPGLVTNYLGTVVKLRRAIMRAAVMREDAIVVAQGLAVNDRFAKAAPEKLKKEAGAAIASR